jgi:aryl-alcohol dehydrogenase-like predicted oxidoreductase
MQYSDLKGLNISKLTLGTVQLGMNYGIHNQTGKPDAQSCMEILKTAEEGGVNCFDTAQAYGDSEVILGDYFSRQEQNGKHNLIVTKFSVTDSERLSSAEIEKQIYKLTGESLERLKIEKIPVYMLHDFKDLILHSDIYVKTLKKLKNEGLIDKAGISVYSSAEVDKIIEFDVFETIQVPMNILDNRLVNSGSIERLAKNNYIIFVRSIFLQGLFFLKPEELAGSLKVAGKYLIGLAGLADAEGLSIAQLAVSYVRDISGVSSLVIGAETAGQVNENIKLIEAPPLSEKTRYEINKLFSEVPEEILVPYLWKC